MNARLGSLARSLILLGFLVVGVPWALTAAARARFGGSNPFHGVPSPGDWELGTILDSITGRLTESTLADVVIRAALVLAWIAVLVVVVTVVAELLHMARHDGIPMPAIRGLGPSQRLARVIATGLLVLLPTVGAPGRAIARDTLSPVDRVPATAEMAVRPTVARPENVWITPDQLVDPAASPTARAMVGAASETTAPPTYVVRAGDSIYGIAQRLAGPDASAVHRYADELVELNLGREMDDGQRFTNAAFIDVGWELRLPQLTEAPGGDYTVRPGESLWSIAADHLGSGERWPEVFELNEGRTFADGRRLTDPDLIQPGWELDLPGPATVAEPDEDGRDAVIAQPDPEPENVWIARDDLPGLDRATDRAMAKELADAPLAEAVDAEPAVEVPTSVTEPPVTASVSEPGDTAPGAWAAAVLAWRDEPIPDRDGIEVTAGSASTDPPSATPGPAAEPDSEVRLLTVGRAAMLSAGILALLGVRRRSRLRRAPVRARLAVVPERAVELERVLRTIDVGERWARVELAVRAAALPLVEAGARVLTVTVDHDGEVELRATGPAELPAPWEGAGGDWRLPAHVPIELLAPMARRSGPPCPTLVQLGVDDAERDLYVDLEAMEAIEIDAPAPIGDAIVAALAATLAGSVLAEVTTLIGVGIPSGAFLGHRHYVGVTSQAVAFSEAVEAIGSTADQDRSTFELRARGTSGEAWEPAVVLAGTDAGRLALPKNRTGLAVVSAAPIHGPSQRLAPDGDRWVLRPAGVRLTPIGLSDDEIAAVARLVDVAPPVSLETAPDPGPDAGADWTLLPDADAVALVADQVGSDPTDSGDDDPAVPDAVPDAADHDVAPEWALVVRLLGPIEVDDRSGGRVDFQRSKARELVAWLATHRGRSARSPARTALWELDVRDSTFANVVSEARRSLARLADPPEGAEWIGRTMTESLPLHELVRTDAELVERALAAARLQPPDQAIATLRPAVEWIVGPPFEGTSYLWPDAEGITSNLVLLATTATAELAAHCLSVGDIGGVFDATARGLQVLPGHEELIGLRMQAHSRAGDLAGVRHEWDRYERVLTRDPWSDGEPSQKLVALRHSLLQQ